jgi:hypothetical protein
MKFQCAPLIGCIPRILVFSFIIINICECYTYRFIELHSTLAGHGVNTVLKVSSPSQTGNSSACRLRVTFRRQTWLHGVSKLCCFVSWYGNCVRGLLFSIVLRFMSLCLFRGDSPFILVCSQQSQNLWM